MTCHHTLLFPQPGVMGTPGTGMPPAHPSPAPQTLPPPQGCTCTSWGGSSGTGTGTGTGMSSFNHGGFFLCKLLVLSCRASDIVPRLSSGLGERRHQSQEGMWHLIPHSPCWQGEQRVLLPAVTDGLQASCGMNSQSAP